MPKEFGALMVLAKKGNARAQFALGRMHANGEGVVKDFKEAEKWYRRAAQHDDPSAQRELGLFLLHGQGVERNADEGIQWYSKAAKTYPSIALELGDLFAEGKLVTANHKEAMKWYRKAADKNLAEGARAIGDLYAAGKGIPKDAKLAVSWYRKAVDPKEFRRTSRTAEVRLGDMYATGQGVKKDLLIAFAFYFRPYASAGSRSPFLVRMDPAVKAKVESLEKKLTPEQFAKAKKISASGSASWIDNEEVKQEFEKTKALALKGNVEAKRELGLLYSTGKGVEKDVIKGFEWWMKAAEKGDAQSQRNIGILLYMGRVHEKDVVRGYAWLFMAIENGLGKEQGLDELNLTPEQITKAKALYKKMIKDNPNLIRQK